MPLIKSLNASLKGASETVECNEPKEMKGAKLIEIVADVTHSILTDSPGLVVMVKNQELDNKTLDAAIVKALDRLGHSRHVRDREQLIKGVFDFLYGYGPLQSYIEDEDISDIDGTRYNEFVIRKNGQRMPIPLNFGSDNAFEAYCHIVAIRNNGILNANDAHCRVSDEDWRLRINLAIPPRNLFGPSISIRKHRKKSYSIEDLVYLDMLDNESAALMRRLAQEECTILFCGKGAAGKTTLLRAFINQMPLMDRILFAESDSEIYPDKPYCISQRIKKENEGGRPVTLRDLVRDGLTMSLDAFVIGEMVGGEAWDFVHGAYSGHRALSTLHSVSAQDALFRLLTLCKMARSGESEDTMLEIIGSAIHYVCYLEAFKLQEVIKVEGYSSENRQYRFQEVWRRSR